ncbi:ClpXP protease specificity-enhancing factor [Bordetella ansorpii]|uniref:ClpXP protease specificity-enhancing factor n=1 Tax=Bordetella ansorpii TaxID=288768 RepID=A0A157S7P2_9BORD|nr:ClpXP protease specificity-enhancing factor [Bordetella ansorpii]SAI66424.1 ClpXP protease specificity-enhancing factor [Bordetella ansorpii]
MGETSTKPYLIRALHEWCTDNGYTPYLTVQVDAHTLVPLAHVRDGQITLNVGTLATNKLVLGNEFIEFQARFSGVTENVLVPVSNVSAIYARETGAGMGFEVQPYEPSEAAAGEEDTGAASASASAALSSVPQSDATAVQASDDDTPDGDEPNKRPRLTIVK